MHPFLAFAEAKQPAIVALIRELARCESPSDQPQAVNHFVNLLASRLDGAVNVKTLPGGRFGHHLRCEFKPSRAKAEPGKILVLAHSDTVWPLGTLNQMPLREEKGRLWGPGVLDMKSGIAFFLYALHTLRMLEIPARRDILFQVNSDEEAGSETSRQFTEEAARHSAVVLLLEPGTGLKGKLKTARKGVGDYTVTVKGKASHAGVDFKAGASAVIELARQIPKIAAFTNVKQGITVNPGVIAGGTRTNVVAAEAHVDVDIRIAKAKDAATLDKKFRSLRPFDKRCSIQVEGGLNRPPMERSPQIANLFQTARACAKELGVTLQESATGGGSDGNFTAALGVPTLDGLGGVGEGAHAANESILLDRIADRTALLTMLLSRL
ncbi:MAG: M20 family metallopeptidase [Bryobacterales bacterium]|nr:M20 family metallopeptidase [Bryobacterales bacterium]